jgi:hypothetical protein
MAVQNSWTSAKCQSRSSAVQSGHVGTGTEPSAAVRDCANRADSRRMAPK